MTAAHAPYISVVIPTYNRAAFVAQAIDSVLAQRDAPWPYEVIVVDDDSTDDTEDVLRPYANAVRYVKIEHSGLPAVARNVGISQARGELVAFLDSDDLWSEDKLAVQVPVFDDPAAVLSYGMARTIYGDDPTPREHIVDRLKLAHGRYFHTLLRENVISTLTVIARRSALIELGGFDESPSLRGVEDYEFWLRVAAASPNQLVSVARVLGLYRVHGGGIGSSDSLGAIRRLIAVYDTVWRCDFLTAGQRAALEAQLLRMHENWSRQAALDGKMPSISVVMSVYRDKPFVGQAVQSILEQTFDDFELVVVDDGSEDGSYDVVTAFGDSRIRIVRQTNHGLVHALNTGIRVARASLIARQDADDISLPTRLEREYAWLAANPDCAVVATYFSYVDEETLEPTGVTITSVTKHLDILRHMYFDNPIGHGTTLIRRSALARVGGYSDAYGPNEDFDLWRRIAAAGGGLALLPDVYYLYRLNSASVSSTAQELQHRLFAELLSEIWRGPVRFKSFWRIALDSGYYKYLASPFRQTVHRQYKEHQIRLTAEFLARRQFVAALHTYLGALLIAPGETAGLGKALLGAAVRRAKRITDDR